MPSRARADASSTGGYAPGTTRSNRRTKTRRSVIDYIITDDLDKIIEAGICDRESADIGSDHRALFIHADVAFSAVEPAGAAEIFAVTPRRVDPSARTRVGKYEGPKRP